MKHDETNPIDPDRYEQLCEFVFGELDDAARAAFEKELAKDPALAAERARLEATVGVVQDALPADELPPAMRATLTEAARAKAAEAAGTITPMPRREGRGGTLSRWFGSPARAAAACLLLLGGGFALNALMGDGFEEGTPTANLPSDRREKKTKSVARMEQREADALRSLGYVDGAEESLADMGDSGGQLDADTLQALQGLGYTGTGSDSSAGEGGSGTYRGPGDTGPPREQIARGTGTGRLTSRGGGRAKSESPATARTGSDGFFLGRGQKEAAPSRSSGTNRMNDPNYALQGAAKVSPVTDAPPGPVAPASASPVSPEAAARRSESATDFEANQEVPADELELLSALGYDGGEEVLQDGDAYDDEAERQARREDDTRQPVVTIEQVDAYAADLFLLCSIAEDETPGAMFFRCWGAHPFQRTADDHLSTFAVDVDTASYTLARRTLQAGRLPVREQVRTEEFVNYFRADQPAPTDDVFAIGVESAPSLFHGDPNVEMLRVTVRGKDVEAFERQPLALTFVIDVSGSMSSQLDLVKRSLSLLLTQLDPRDSIALIKFSTEASVVSPMDSAAQRGAVEDALAALGTEGGTNVESGLRAGYELAANALTRGAVNRVILLSDGVGNIGETQAETLLALVDEHKTEGVYLNTIGVGLGDDDFLEQLANRGDGVCLYIDSEEAAQKALVDEFTKTLQPIARDVKIQVEFDPNQVERYRQLGYENRVIADADFRKDAVDAGEVNAGHQVTALYEIVRVGGRTDAPLATVRVRYKPPFAVDEGQLGRRAKADAEVALEIERATQANDFLPTFETGSAGYRRAVLVAQFAELLRESVHTRDDSLDHFEREVMRFADRASDEETIEFSELVAIALPMLREREAERSDELQDLIEELCQLEYSAGVREQMARREEAPEPDPEVERAFQEEIEGVQAKIRELLGARFGLTEAEIEKAEKLKALGYQR